MSQLNFSEITRFIPSATENLNRLKYLLTHEGDVRIAVFGKYNHGKSTLLNALVEEDVFVTGDKRVTIENKNYAHGGVEWIDTPGLDADTNGEDDRRAREGAFEIADFLFLVHNVKVGELDKYERSLHEDLMKQDTNYKNKMFLILTQVDQLEQDDLDRVINSIHQQLPDITTIPVSAVRYLKGIREGKSKFVELSGMESLTTLTDSLKNELSTYRNQEVNRLIDKVRQELKRVEENLRQKLSALSSQKQNITQDFRLAVDKTLAEIAAQA